VFTGGQMEFPGQVVLAGQGLELQLHGAESQLQGVVSQLHGVELQLQGTVSQVHVVAALKMIGRKMYSCGWVDVQVRLNTMASRTKLLMLLTSVCASNWIWTS
jgi:hypothetical protein